MTANVSSQYSILTGELTSPIAMCYEEQNARVDYRRERGREEVRRRKRR